MKKEILKLAFLLCPSLLLAQFSVDSELSFDYGKDAEIQGVDAVVVLERIDASTVLSYDFPDSMLVEWHYHTASSDSLILSSVVNDTLVTLDSLQQGLYELRLNDSTSYYYSVIDFSEYQGHVDSVWVDDSGDSCNTVRLYAHLIRQDIPVYDKVNDSTHLLLEPVVEYLWTNETEGNSSPSRIDAPFENIDYACIPYADDFFTSNDGGVRYYKPDTVFAEPYTAKAVKLVLFEATIPDDDGKSNLKGTSTVTEGSAPLDVTYSISSEGNTELVKWWIWNVDDEKPVSPTYRNNDTKSITYTFLKYALNGYRVQVQVETDFCQVTDSMEVKVKESYLEVPNILILGFGASGKFKVAHNSLDPSTFKAAVYDRNGRLVYKWHDPNGGWDGRSPVTGAYVSPGAYYYSIQARGTDGERYKEIGDVSVIREKGID